MEPDEVDSALQSVQQFFESIDVALLVIDTFEYGVLERDSTLSGEIIFLDLLDNFGNREGFLCWHDFQSLLRNWIVEADC